MDRYFHGAAYQANQIEYQSQLKYRYRQDFEFGLQVFGNLGAAGQFWANYARQVHRIGPLILGRILLPQARSISCKAAFLLGTTAQSPDHTLRYQIEYEF